MMRKILIIALFLSTIAARAQQHFNYHALDEGTQDPLINATIHYFKGGKMLGLITNRKGDFSIDSSGVDSMRVSMIGYQSRLFAAPFARDSPIALRRNVLSMDTVIVKTLSAEDIVERAISFINRAKPVRDFQDLAFYREVIKDKDTYFSVSEALFKVQYFPSKADYKLSLERGRAKEDVAYTRLFEDYHPGGGPALLAGQELAINIPECLQTSRKNDYIFKKGGLVYQDNRPIYIIEFDEKDGVKEALEKGKIYIDAKNFSVLQYIAFTSPKGSKYIKSLTGGDKIVAKLLNIEMNVIGWSRKLSFLTTDSSVLLNFATYQKEFSYKQPKKNIDLHLLMSFEWMASETGLPVTVPIKNDEEWKKNNLMVNLPTRFDSAFWGDRSILAPTDSINAIVQAISNSNREGQTTRSIEEWKLYNIKYFVAYIKEDTIVLTPTMKSNWENEDSGPFLYKEVKGDFAIECNLKAVKTTNAAEQPDRGFQQGGLMIRSPDSTAENYVFLAMGTGGNANAKLFFKSTGKSKTNAEVNKITGLSGRLRLEKKQDEVKAYARISNEASWKLIGSEKAAWISRGLQVGMAGFANFSGNGPKMHPDADFKFSNIQLKQ